MLVVTNYTSMCQPLLFLNIRHRHPDISSLGDGIIYGVEDAYSTYVKIHETPVKFPRGRTCFNTVNWVNLSLQV